jgi:tetratricopeptide (TPR) repeat protein
VLKEKRQTAWLPCVDNALANAFVRRKEWRLALHALDTILEFLPDATRAFYPEENTDTLSGAFKCEVLSRQGRIMLQIGALLEASTLFEEVKKEWNTKCTLNSSHTMFQNVPTQIRINDGLACFAHGQYDQAMTHYRKAIDLERSKTTCGEYRNESLLLRQDAHQLSHCWNNMALCALYTCRMQDAVRMMESVIREDPTLFLTERLAFNLCTLYELGSDAAAGTRKKRVLQVISKRFYLHDIGPESFRVSP